MISYLCIYGQIDIVSVHNGTKSKLNINFSENENDFGFSEVKTEPTTENNGTIIRITNVDMSIDDGDKDKIDLEQWLGCVYYITKQNNPNFKIILRSKEKSSDVYESKELQFFDPMYRDISVLNPHAINKILDNEKYDVGGEEVTMSIYQYNREIFNNEDLFSAFDRKTSKKGGLLKGKFIYKKCGIYWRLGNRYSNFGFGNFISMNAQHTLDNVRIEIKIEGPKLMKLFNVNQNKSRVSAPNYKQINKVSGLKKLIDDLTKHVTALHNLSTDKTKEVTEIELNECEIIEKQLNMLGDICGITKGGDLPTIHIPEETKIKDDTIYQNNLECFKEFCEKNKLIRNSVDECREIDEFLYSVREIEYAFRETTFIRHKISSPIERGPFKLRYVNGHKKDNFIRLVGMNDKKYVFECNKSHPFYEYCYSKLDGNSKFLIVVNHVTIISSLLSLQTDNEIDKDTSNRIMELNSQSLENLVYKLQNKIPNLTF